jgi:putative transposase
MRCRRSWQHNRDGGARRGAVQLLVARGLPQRRAWVLRPRQRSTFGYQARPARDVALTTPRNEPARQHPRHGYRRVWALLRRRGHQGNQKHGHRLWKQARLQVRKVTRQRRLARRAVIPVQATHPGHVWTYDLLHDRGLKGTPLKVVTVMDECTRAGLGPRGGHVVARRASAGYPAGAGRDARRAPVHPER